MNKKKLCLSIFMIGLILIFINSYFMYAKEGKPEASTSNKKFIVGFDAEFPPYGYMDENGEYVGFDLDLAEEVCKRNNWEFVKQPIAWESKDSELESNAISCIWNGFTMNGRETDYTWSTPYIDNSQVVIVKADSSIKTLDDLKGKILAVQTDSSAEASLVGEEVSDRNKAILDSLKELQRVSDYNSAFMNMETGMVDAVAMDIGVAQYQLEGRENEFIILEDTLSSEQYGIGFKLGNTELRDAVQKTMLEMLCDGTFEHIAKKWDLTDNLCLSLDDKKYIDGAEVVSVDPDSIEKKEFDDEVARPKKTTSTSQKIKSAVKQLSKGIIPTLTIFGLTLLFSLPLGLLLSFARMSKIKIVQLLAKLYISIMRGTPLMLQLLVVCFAPYYVFNINTSSSFRLYAVIIGFSLNYAAYFAEIFRSGIQSIPNGQREAALILGYGRFSTFRKIIFPQMIKRVMPSVTNEIITLVKDTSLAFALSYAEMFTMAKQVAASQTSMMPLFIAGLFYYIFNFIVAIVMEYIEKKLNYYN